jgi:uncharacterized membrane protein YqjE
VVEPGENKRGGFASLGRILRTLLATGHNRLELLMVEMEEERWRFFNSLLLVGLTLILFGMTLLVATVAIVVICLHRGRIDLIVALTALYLVATIISFWRLRVRARQRALFAATLAELRKDKACWEEKS